MNINYAQIIENANARKDNLQHFAGLLKELPERVTQLQAALVYFDRLLDAETALDVESRTLVQHEAVAVRQVAHPLVAAKKQVEFVPNGWSKNHLQTLMHLMGHAA